jgi:pimeloyl-ACP methyl ester carboxylesterase
LEPLQTALTLNGQAEELRRILEQHADGPVTMIGFSWGAWLGWIVAARYPDLVRKLILVSSAGFGPADAFRTQAVRWSRLGEQDRLAVQSLAEILKEPSCPEQDAALARLGAILSKADAFDPLPDDTPVEVRANIYTQVWKEADALRNSGGLLDLGRRIHCPVVAIHGEHDSHSGEGVVKPLSGLLRNFRFISLPRCGHKPWIERQARETFFSILKQEIEI